MTVPVEDQDIRPRAAWYAVPAVLWLIGLTLFVIALIAIANVINSGIDSTPNNGVVDVPSDGLTVYTTDPASTADCSLIAADGTSTHLDSLNITLEIHVNGPIYYGVGVTPGSLEAGQYQLSCTDVTATTRLGVGPRVDVTAIATRALWGIFLPMALGVIGLVVLVVVIVRRHTAKSRLKTMRAYAGTGYGTAWNQPYGPYGPASGLPPPPPPPGQPGWGQQPSTRPPTEPPPSGSPTTEPPPPSDAPPPAP